MQLTIEAAVWYIVAIAVVLVVLYLSVRLVAEQKRTDAPYILRLLGVSIIAVFVIPALSTISTTFNLPELGPIIAYVALLWSIRLIIEVKKGERISYPHAIWISLICLGIILGINLATETFFNVTIIQILSP